MIWKQRLSKNRNIQFKTAPSMMNLKFYINDLSMSCDGFEKNR